MRYLVLEKGVDPTGEYLTELVSNIFYIRGSVTGIGRVNNDGLVEVRFDSYYNYIEEIIKHPDLEAIVLNLGGYGSVFIRMDDIVYINATSEVKLSDEDLEELNKPQTHYHKVELDRGSIVDDLIG